MLGLAVVSQLSETGEIPRNNCVGPHGFDEVAEIDIVAFEDLVMSAGISTRK